MQFRRARTPADQLPAGEGVPGTRDQSRLVAERYGIRAWAVPGQDGVCLVVRATKGSFGSSGCTRAEDDASYKAGLRPLGSVMAGPRSWRPHRRLVTLLLADGTRDVELRRGTNVTEKLSVRDNAVQVRPMTATSISWRAADGSQRRLTFG